MKMENQSYYILQQIIQILIRFQKHIQIILMTSFNIQSQFLDLKKTYQNFEYQNLTTQGIVTSEEVSNDQDVYQGMTQNTYLFVQEKSTLTKDIQSMSIYFLHKHYELNPQVKEEAFKKFPYDKVRDRVCFIFQKYQQQPCLLDTLLQSLIQPIMEAVKRYLSLLLKQNYEKPVTDDLHSLLQIIYQLTKVRGKKWVIQYFPHEVKDLYPAIGYLVKERTDQNSNWQTRYVILLWLGVIAMVPFNLDIIDSGVVTMPKEDGRQATQIVDLMIQIGKLYLKSLTKMRQASALFLGKLFTRPDIQKMNLLPEYVNYVLNKLVQVKDNPMENFFVCGLYYSLCHIFKRVQRKQLLPLISPVLEHLRKEKQIVKDNGAKRELKMKLLTQIGLTYLKPRVVNWAYKKKKQSLLTNLSKTLKTTTIQTNTGSLDSKENKNQNQEINEQNDVEYYRDVNKENLEEVIDMLVDGLSQKQTPVREKSSKGLGKIAGRLSQDMVLDIIDYILNLTPSPQTQHAICLTIAEFIRRNLVSPQKLVELYQIMKDSLLYEQQEGGYSIGQAVRDAACYMTWSVARAYEQGGYDLGLSLMIAACFDRQVGCRRAASAAYQQLVGRVGDVPNGIQILTEADYFTLGLQKNAYLNVAIFVASYDAYFKPFVEHLCYQKLRHWDLQVKRIAACSLSMMSPLNPSFIAKELLPSLTKYLRSDSMNVKLGSIIGIGQILLGLKGKSVQHQLQNQMKDSVFLKSLTQNEKKLLKAGEYMEQFKNRYAQIQNKDNFAQIPSETLQEIANILQQKIKDGKMYKGKAGQNFRIYTCRLLQCFAICGIPLSQSQVQCFIDFIQQNIKNTLEPIIQASVKCMKPFLLVYHNVQKDQKFIKTIVSASRASSKTLSIISKGYTLALSKFTRDIYLHHFTSLLDAFEHNCRITKENDDPQKRKYAILGIQALVQQVGFSSQILRQPEIQRIFNILFSTLNDYTMDKRGDIGSIVRQASMSTLMEIIKRYISEKQRKWKISQILVTKMIGHFLQQLSQKIDRIRLLSGSLLQNFFDFYQQAFQIPDQKILVSVFGQQNIKKLIKESESKIDSNLQTDVIRMEMKIQQTIFHETQRYLIYFWNLPHSVYPIVVPFLESQAYSIYILKGLCTSTGGISQSIIKYSLQQLGNYLTHIFKSQKFELMERLLKQIIQILKQHFRDDRIIVPMYKTLDYILERQQVINWQGLKKFDFDLYACVERQVIKTKSIVKVSASTGLYVSLLIMNNPQTKKPILESIVKILCSDLPKARKVLSDKLLFFLMGQEEFLIFSEEGSEELMNILSQNDFLDEKLDVEGLKDEIKKHMGVQN